jgi:predicted nucleic acid-binding protein
VVSELEDVRLILYPHAPLRSHVWELRDDASAYDALYLARAQTLDGSVLITSDSGFGSQLRTRPSGRVASVTLPRNDPPQAQRSL